MGATSPQAEAAYTLLLQIHELVMHERFENYRLVVDLAKKAVQIAPEGSYESAVAKAYVAIYATFIGLWDDTETYAHAFGAMLLDHPKAWKFVPYVKLNLATAYRVTGREVEACNLLREALPDAEGEIAERLRLCLVWALCEAGKPGAAREQLPEAVYHLPEAFRRAAQARILAARGDWKGAKRKVRAILSKIAGIPLYDQMQFQLLRRICRVLEQEARRRGNPREAQFWASKAADLMALPTPSPSPGEGLHPTGARPPHDPPQPARVTDSEQPQEIGTPPGVPSLSHSVRHDARNLVHMTTYL